MLKFLPETVLTVAGTLLLLVEGFKNVVVVVLRGREAEEVAIEVGRHGR